MAKTGVAVAIFVALTLATLARAAGERTIEIRRKLLDPAAGIFVIAHRGCHNPIPSKGLDSLPENSLPALERCIALRVDMMETDIHRTRDGVLVIMHDDTVDRTTDGTGAVADLTLAEIRQLHLRRNMGAPTSMAVTSERVPTLDDLLAKAKGRILINLDIKGPIYREVIEAAVHDGVAGDVVDVDALRDPSSVWGRLMADGITAFQTDEPAALLDFVQHTRR